MFMMTCTFSFVPKNASISALMARSRLSKKTLTAIGGGQAASLRFRLSAAPACSEDKGEHFVFRGELKHLEYWSNFSLPVLLVICDPATRVAYWAEVVPRLVERTDSGWKLNVFKTNSLKASHSQLIEVAKRNFLTIATELSAQAWFHSRSKERVELCGIFQMPRDYHWYSHLVKVGDAVVMLHWLTARYGEFDVLELKEALRYLPSNRTFSQRLIVGLISETIDAFDFSDEWVAIAQQEPAVEYVKLVLNEQPVKLAN